MIKSFLKNLKFSLSFSRNRKISLSNPDTKRDDYFINPLKYAFTSTSLINEYDFILSLLIYFKVY